MMTWKEILWHLVRLALAAVLLWWDTRLFLFYAFTILLMVLRSLDYVRALVRIYQVANEAKLMALMRHLNVPEEVVRRVANMREENLTYEQQESLKADLKRVRV